MFKLTQKVLSEIPKMSLGIGMIFTISLLIILAVLLDLIPQMFKGFFYAVGAYVFYINFIA